MSSDHLISTQDLAHQLDTPARQNSLVLVDVRPPELYAAGHLPGARQLDYARIIRSEPPMGGLLPHAKDFNAVLNDLGINEDSTVIAYDQDGGAAASRLLWTLHAYGFTRTHLLNGGINTWSAQGRSLVNQSPKFARSTLTLAPTGDAVIDAETLMDRLDDPNLAVLDARTSGEYVGSDVRANHGGRIPGAKHFEWTDSLDRSNDLQLLPDQVLLKKLDQLGITPDKEVVVYCQTHHRSSQSYIMLRHLGFTNVSALNGAWSNWGNREDTPKETGNG